MSSHLLLFLEKKQLSRMGWLKNSIHTAWVFVMCVLLFLPAGNAFSQDNEITTRDTLSFKFKIRKNIIPDYEKLLNFISSTSTEANEVLGAIKNSTTTDKRIFENEKAVIENDLIPGADSIKEYARDMQVEDYLGNFNVMYKKSDNNTVRFTITNADISPLQKTTFFYFKVFFECTYYSTNTQGEKLNAFKRVAEVKLNWENNQWRMYIISVRFPREKDYTDQTNTYTGVKKTVDDVAQLLADFDSDEKRRVDDEKRKIFTLIGEGDDEFDKGNFEGALPKYREAFSLNISNADAKTKLANAKKAIEDKRKKDQAEKERNEHIAILKSEMDRQYQKYNFDLAKQLCDSLINEYKVSDSDVQQTSSELTDINAALTGIETAISGKNLNAAVKNCKAKIEEAKYKKQSYQAELYYQLAFIYYTLDNTERSKIFENLDKCIGLSNKKHQHAIHLRAEMYMSGNDVIKSIDDASLLIGNDSRNEKNYSFRAYLYERNGQKLKAIEDYGKAILYNTTDSSIYFKKAKLEYDTLKYKDAQTTASAGIDKTTCYGQLYFLRGKANDKLKNFEDAGKDFAKASLCGIGSGEKQWVKNLSENYISEGRNAYLKAKYIDALTELSKAINIDSSEKALYWRACASVQLKKDDKAISDLDLLLRLNKTYQDAHNQRGLILKRMGMYYEAINDFDLELAKYPNTYQSVLERGNCLMIQQKFPEAAIAFDRAASLAPSDSVWHLSSLAYYNNKNYQTAVERSKKARDKGTKKYEVYYICGRAYYDMKSFKDAYKEYEKAREIIETNEDVNFNYALALEADEQYLNAGKVYSSVFKSTTLKDTALYRSAMCYIKRRDDKFYSDALKNLANYVNGNASADKSLVYAWMGFVALLNNDFNQVNEYISKSQEVNKEQPVLYYLLACKNAQQDNATDAVTNLEKLIAAKVFKKEEIENESLLKPIRRNDAYKKLMAKNFP